MCNYPDSMSSATPLPGEIELDAEYWAEREQKRRAKEKEALARAALPNYDPFADPAPEKCGCCEHLTVEDGICSHCGAKTWERLL